jgi:SRSO17 transposase
VAAGHSADADRWLGALDELMLRVGSRFRRVEPRRRARAFVLGLLAELPRKNCWTIAGHAGDATPDGMQHLLARARRDAGRVRDDLRSYVAAQLGDPDAVLVVDETGDVKKAPRRPASSASTPARPGGSRTRRWLSTWAMLPRPGTR